MRNYLKGYVYDDKTNEEYNYKMLINISFHLFMNLKEKDRCQIYFAALKDGLYRQLRTSIIKLNIRKEKVYGTFCIIYTAEKPFWGTLQQRPQGGWVVSFKGIRRDDFFNFLSEITVTNARVATREEIKNASRSRTDYCYYQDLFDRTEFEDVYEDDLF